MHQADCLEPVLSSLFCFLNNCRFFRLTRRRDIAAGVTPDILPACPIVAGLTVSSFWQTSFDNPLMDE
jgi:hypothetical protein